MADSRRGGLLSLLISGIQRLCSLIWYFPVLCQELVAFLSRTEMAHLPPILIALLYAHELATVNRPRPVSTRFLHCGSQVCVILQRPDHDNRKVLFPKDFLPAQKRYELFPGWRRQTITKNATRRPEMAPPPPPLFTTGGGGGADAWTITVRIAVVVLPERSSTLYVIV